MNIWDMFKLIEDKHKPEDVAQEEEEDDDLPF